MHEENFNFSPQLREVWSFITEKNPLEVVHENFFSLRNNVFFVDLPFPQLEK